MQDIERKGVPKKCIGTQKNLYKRKYLKTIESTSTDEEQDPPKGPMKKINEIEDQSTFSAREMVDVERMIESLRTKEVVTWARVILMIIFRTMSLL